MNSTRRDFLKLGGGAAATAGLGATAGCTSVLGATGTDAVKVSSMRFPEAILLGYMALESLRANTDLTVHDETGLGGTVMNFRAVDNGEVDLFWFYTGGAWATIPPKKERVIPDAEKLYEAVKRKFERHYGLAYLNRAPFNNTYVLIADRTWVEQTGVQTMSDFAAYVKQGNTDFTAVMGPEFQQRSDGWPGLTKHYGFDGVANELNIRTVSPSLAYQIVATSDANVGMGFSTNPQILQYDLATIEDDQGFFPIYNPAPMVSDAIERYPTMAEPLNAIGPSLNTEKIIRLNKAVLLDGRDPQRVAREYLQTEGLI
ncbi:glycine betaine ABC transporter substrate-binding protein [Halococcus saccharolyticus]|uniref:Glycine/betaine ABC transporter substrate-binding protein n=1 Tax=Halococcus saccharolyticus DSM 5350 TaxID=1227455 RepID=M0MPW0_9EURY|nr:glycine betaine ABC transporter substrate-binding protein [Halococcus saccharolyticus]EMA47393.1 glycine/betaine ABC transporter substrate-binding protein [Halococcus saccharolyticus DSM 5350]